MSGICGVSREPGFTNAAGMVASLNEGLCQTGTEQLRQSVAGAGGVGVCSIFGTQQIYETSIISAVCDADLYNEADLWRLTCGEGSRGGTGALLIAMYERFGPAFVEKLRGAFSLILWDNRDNVLLAALDGFGMKRLVYHESGSGLLIASRIDALLRLDEVNRDINLRAVANVLNYTASLAPETIFRSVRRLTPGSLVVAADRQVRTKTYWDMRYGVANDASEEELSRGLEAVVQDSVARHCRADSFATLGAALSGGTDSSTVLGMMSRAGGVSPKAFSIGFREQPFDELDYARVAARRFHADHHTLLAGPDECFDALPDIVRSFDEPFGNSSAIPTYLCARLAAREGVKILLAGDGGDELFGGNERYRTEAIFQRYQHLPRRLRKLIIEPALCHLPFEHGLIGKARRYIRRSNLPSPQRVLSYHFLCAHPVEEVFEGNFLEALGGYSVLAVPSEYYGGAPARDHLDRLLYLDVKVTLGDNDLPKVTCMYELAGIQARFPFLDRSVADFSGRIPARLKLKGLEKRYLFKRAFRNLLPAEIIAKKKHGFGIPVAAWLRSDPRLRELGRDMLLSARAFQRGYFRRAFIEDLFRKHEADVTTYYGDTLWTFLMLELWHRRIADTPVGMAA